MNSNISKYFSGVGIKRLSDVEVLPDVSNQHEFNGITGLKKIFGTGKTRFQGHFIYLSDNEEQVIEEQGRLTWYDAREDHPTRTEYRLYYSSNSVIKKAASGDLVLIGRTGEDQLLVVVAPQGSTSEQQLLWLFGIQEVENRFVIKDLTSEDHELNYAGRIIVSALGIEIVETVSDYLEELMSRFDTRFPSTYDFSNYARSTVTDIDPVEEPDNTLIAFLEREEVLFKTLEKHIVEERLSRGFGKTGTDVDEFIAFSLSVQNRRKSRAGHAFEHHLAYIFDHNKLAYSKGKKTERNNKPDFIFPGIVEYQNPDFDASLLTMLGVKTTAKDRWRQVLAEANRIQGKHLITLEPAISLNQTEEMQAQQLQLVIPRPLYETYSQGQQRDLIDLSEFISLVREKQQRR